MSSRSNHRLVVGALALCALLALAARPAQARESAGLVDALAARLHALVPAWWSWAAAGTQSAGVTDSNVQARSAAPGRAVPGRQAAPGSRHVQRVHPGRGIRIECSGLGEPNGCPGP
jgi:hypothetical protein